MKKIWGKAMALLLTGAMALSLTACGSEKTSGDVYVYVPETVSVEMSGDIGWNSIFSGDRLYYWRENQGEDREKISHRIYYREADNMEQEIPLDMEPLKDAGYVQLICFTMDEAENLYVLSRGENTAIYLSKYDSMMQQVFSVNIENTMPGSQEQDIIGLKVDSDGMIYGAGKGKIYVFGSDGQFQKSVNLNMDYIVDFAVNTGGTIYFYESMEKGKEITSLAVNAGEMKMTRGNLPESFAKIKALDEKTLLLMGNSKLYEYDIYQQKAEELLTWMDCNIEGNTVWDCSPLEDGRILVVCEGQQGAEFVVLTERNAAGEEKEVIVVATLVEENGPLKEAAVSFNKKSDSYWVELRHYIDLEKSWSGISAADREDALARMNADLVSGNSPDIIQLDYLDWRNLTQKDVLEDLSPYIKESKKVKEKHFVSSVYQAYQIEGKQVAIPACFTVSTLMGKAEMVGETPGWTIEEMKNLAKAYPNAQLTDFCTPLTVLSNSMYYWMDTFVDREAGTCDFDSPDFVALLEFANSYEASTTTDSLPIQLQKGQTLLGEVNLSATYMMQMFWQVFEGQGTCIGYPTADGSPCSILHCSQIYGMVAKSDNKTGSWEFLEGLLSKEEAIRSLGFPSRKDLLQEMFEEAMEPNYVYVDGKIVKDENGEKVQYPKSGVVGYEDWNTELYAATKEEIAALEEVIEAGRVPDREMEVLSGIVREEAASYFEGQKSAQEVAVIIQNRAQLYLEENQ